MNEDLLNTDLGIFLIIFSIASIVISVIVIMAVLKIPTIAKYHKATMILTAMMAKRAGVDREFIEQTINAADDDILKENGRNVEKQLFN